MDTYRWILETVLRSDQQKGFKIFNQLSVRIVGKGRCEM